jgi:glyoxalase family protein
MASPRRIHHFAFIAGTPEPEIAFHEGVLGLQTVEQREVTARGRRAIQLWFGASASPREGFLKVTCLGDDGPRGRLGSNGPKTANLSVAPGTLDYWQRRLHEAHVESERTTHLGADRLEFEHPTGVSYSLVEDPPSPDGSAPPNEPSEYTIRGLHSVTISLMDVRETHDFLVELLAARHITQDLAWGLYEFEQGGPGNRIELLHEPYRAPGTWAFAVGAPHHVGLDTGSHEQRHRLCERLIDAGYPDVSSSAQHGTFDSVWVRAAGGTLLELVAEPD